MFQRIQTIYFFLALVAMTIAIIFPAIRFVGEEGQAYLLQSWGIIDSGKDSSSVLIGSIPLLVLYIIIPLLLLICLFSFRKRIIQIRFSIFSILLMVGSLALIYFYRRHGMINLNADAFFTIFAALPIVSAILTYLGFRGVKRDEEIIKSYDRIR